MNNAVEVKNLSKRYTIGQKERYLTLRDLFVKAAKAPINLAKGKKFAKKEQFWALKDINFEVKEGEVVGIIGRNGAGKSTLLKILSRITEPTEGEVRLNGRVSSLLEVGTGFHPELTGRENIYLNGAILGMRRREIDEKFDEIVEFSGVEKFLDMPVKRYSSGMQVRLAFSIAAHLEPDILIIDEVLAVGDAEFQKKCLGKMDQVTKEAGRTILFVSHDMGAVQKLCKRTLLIEDGHIVFDGDTNIAINKYLQESNNLQTCYEFKNDISKELKILKVNISDNEGKETSVFDVDKSFKVSIDYAINVETKIASLAAILTNSSNQVVFASASVDTLSEEFKPKKRGLYKATFEMPKSTGLYLNRGLYWLRISLGEPNTKAIDSVENILINFKIPKEKKEIDIPERIAVLTINSKWEISN